MVNAYGWIKEETGSYALGLMPVACLTVASIIMLLVLSSGASQAARKRAANAAA
jgi:hypothetical protein